MQTRDDYTDTGNSRHYRFCLAIVLKHISAILYYIRPVFHAELGIHFRGNAVASFKSKPYVSFASRRQSPTAVL